MTALRAGLIGFGQMGRHHARVLADLDGVELVAVAEPEPPQRVPYTIVRNVEDLILHGVDLAVVAVPTALHEDIARPLVEAGVHVLIEKPVAGDVATSLRMAEAFEAAGLVGCVGHIERFNPALRELRRRLTAGELGEIYQVMTRRQGPFPERISDVGVVLDLATHDIDLTAWVTQSRYADIAVRTTHRSGRDREDLLAAVGRLEDGTVVSHLVNWLSPLKERVTLVLGERGCFTADTLTADLTFYANGVTPVAWDSLRSFKGVVVGDVTRFAIPKQEPLRLELMAFRDAVLGDPSDVVSIRDAAETVGVAEAMLASAQSSETARPGSRQ